MAKANESMNYTYCASEATKCENTCVSKLRKYNQELDDLIIKNLQPYWKSRKANKLYKKFKGHINNNYKWIESISNVNQELIRAGKVAESSGD